MDEHIGFPQVGDFKEGSIPQYRKKNWQKQMKNRYRIYDLNYGAGSLSQTEPLPCLVCKGLAFHRGGLGEVLLPRSLLFPLRRKTAGARCVLGSRFH